MKVDATSLVYLAGFLVATTLSWIVTPIAGKIARRLKALDTPDHRKLHVIPIPRLGGMAIYFSMLATFLILPWVFAEGRSLVWSHLEQFLLLAGGCTLMFAVGALDDIRGVRVRTKLGFQAIAALVVFFAGFHFPVFHDLDHGITVWGVLSLGLTVFWIVGTTNAVNLIDGLDGLASGITAIALVILGFISAKNGQHPTALAAFIGAGASIGFLRHNRHPARIFMGDSGSLVLGFYLASLSLLGTRQGSVVATLVGPLCLLFVPLLDTTLAMVRRIQKGLPVSFPDKHHLHHRLLSQGIKHPTVVAILWVVAFSVASLAVVFHFLPLQYHGFFANAFAIILLFLTIRFLARHEIESSIRSMRMINRRKLTPREKVLLLRKGLEDAHQQATANSLLDGIQNVAEMLELDGLHITMHLKNQTDKNVTVFLWDRMKASQEKSPDWTSSPLPMDSESATAEYPLQPDVRITVQVSRSQWKHRRKSEDMLLWARIMVEKLATSQQIKMFCPWEVEDMLTLTETV
jgi:UDP-GlcNAc:undecaprenyl-phosphate/decaprenyl-phosphate GlcNAc-1-phosphate transferase